MSEFYHSKKEKSGRKRIKIGCLKMKFTPWESNIGPVLSIIGIESCHIDKSRSKGSLKIMP